MGNALRGINLLATRVGLAIPIRPDRLLEVAELIEDSVNINIPGAWNRAVINPEWLRGQFPDVISDDHFELQFPRSNPALPLVYKFTAVQVAISEARLIIKPASTATENLNSVTKIGKGICERLAHTPISGVGHNFHYSLSEDEEFEIWRFVLEDKLDDFYRPIGLPNRTAEYGHCFSFTDHDLNLGFQSRLDGKTLTFNFHYVPKPLKEISAAVLAFEQNFLRSQELTERLIFTTDVN